MKLKTAALAALLGVCLVFTGCNAYQVAQRAHDIVAGITAVAQADLPSLEATGVFSQQEGVAISNYLALATNLNAQYETCITTANTVTIKRSGKFLACLTTFSAGLNDPKELAGFRVMNPKAQQEIQLWLTASTVAINSVIAALGGAPQTVPQVAHNQPARSDLVAFAQRAASAYASGLWPLPLTSEASTALTKSDPLADGLRRGSFRPSRQSDPRD